ncbi:MAG: aminodeoxychorismate/anthranilate synthase component II [Bacteroidetes bacterium RIFCSPLOWO2_02_FULL_36_8]|nr:MAG: aminodeoxychorismate/anthranilate synthase component II [Bacteroidetes bacterium RIFCSPLOWO2_02_FULL_36_8]OFY71154.1 MAG: aminodeoxychorismate/anthranilate synthase component II [Bacteroidetes bacterium RIFCSPLOWO2_12_FULL_37_12]
MKILVLDNYDSFTYNLVHYLEKTSDAKVDVFRNDKISLKEINRYDKILLSPGPGIPKDAGILLDVIKEYSGKKSVLGICLGQQAIAEVFGCKLKNLKSVYHGVATEMEIVKDDILFKGLPGKFKAGRYHSWVVDENNFPDELEITCKDEKGYVMGLRHKKFDVRGVQFHPESILTEFGLKIIENWVKF